MKQEDSQPTEAQRKRQEALVCGSLLSEINLNKKEREKRAEERRQNLKERQRRAEEERMRRKLEAQQLNDDGESG